MTREQLGVCDAVAKHFSITKAKVRAAVEVYLEENNQWPALEIAVPEHIIYIGTSKNSIALGKMLFFKYLEKSDLYSDIVNFENNYDTDVVAFYSGGALLVSSLAEEYNGVGGVFVKKEKERFGYAIEPIAHYLQRNYPICRED
jgi:hypothetical protein